MSRRGSCIAKGLAILMMLWHHLFYSPEEVLRLGGGRAVCFWPLGEPLAYDVASACKACVAVFVFISGYGTFRQVVALRERGGPGFCLQAYSPVRYVKLVAGLWAVYVPAALCGAVSGLRNPLEVYQWGAGKPQALLSFLFDVAEISNAMGTPTLNPTWWYMSLAVLLVFVLPAFALLAERVGGFAPLVAALLVPPLAGLPWSTLSWYAPAALLGVAAAQYGLFERVSALVAYGLAVPCCPPSVPWWK